jgi:hypothetical protein
MSLDGVSSLVRSCALLLLGAAALVFALRGATPAFAQTPPPSAVCATFQQVNDGKILSSDPKLAEAWGRWVDARQVDGRDAFMVVPMGPSYGVVCAW